MLKIRKFLEYKKCSFCNKEFLTNGIQKINNQDYICDECKTSHSYTTRNTTYKGKESKISFSFEFETSNRINSLYELQKYNFIGCYDGSIEGLEWKSRAKRSQLKRLGIKIREKFLFITHSLKEEFFNKSNYYLYN